METSTAARIENRMTFYTDSTDYHILEHAAQTITKTQVPGAALEIGVRLGGSLKIIMDNTDSHRLIIGVDPYGDIPYTEHENQVVKLDYTNDMRDQFLRNLYTSDVQHNVLLFNMEDTEFFERFADGVPHYQTEKKLNTQYALVHFDGPHSSDHVSQEVLFFAAKTPYGGVWVFDDVSTYNHQIVHKLILQLGFEPLLTGTGTKISYVKTGEPLLTAVINLRRRPQRLQLFAESMGDEPYWVFQARDGVQGMDQKKYMPAADWIDPLEDRPLTEGEVGCFRSHYELWEMCARYDIPMLILEDDVRLQPSYDRSLVQKYLDQYNLVYLSAHEMNTSALGDQHTVIPQYPYWACAYAITPECARLLISTPVAKNIIPVDEYLPLMLGYPVTEELHTQYSLYEKITACEFKQHMFKPESRSVMGTDTETQQYIRFDQQGVMIQPDHDQTESYHAQQTRVFTVATDRSKAQVLLDSCRAHHMDITVLGENQPWRSGDMTAPGGIEKVKFLEHALKDIPDQDIILFLDGYDVFVADSLGTIQERFLGFDCDVLFAAEKTCWPAQELAGAFPASPYGTDYIYLNSGCFIGRAGALRKLFDHYPWDQEGQNDDQLWYQLRYLNQRHIGVKISLDTECYVFQCVAGAHQHIKKSQHGQILNTETNCSSCVLHGNGGESEKEFFLNMAMEFGYLQTQQKKLINYVPTRKYQVIGPEMLMVDFMTPGECNRLIELADACGTWAQMEGDKFPAQEIRLKDIDVELWAQLNQHFEQVINPIVERHWPPLLMYGLRDAFVMRYSMDTQTSLPLHNDASLVTGSIKLNDDYTGGVLEFPRQNFTNTDIPVGKMILFPGMVTHGHRCNQLTAGTKYSFTIWSSRFPGDINC